MSFDESLFSKRELAVVNLLLKGKSNKQMAVELGVTSRTVEFHLGKIYAKLEVASRAEAILKLTGSQLRETENIHNNRKYRESTVETKSDPFENRDQNIFRRIDMKKMVYVIGIVVLIILAFVLWQPKLSRVDTNTTSTLLPSATEENPPTATLPALTETPPLADLALQSHTVNGITAAIVSYYVDTSHVTFQLRITGGDIKFGSPYYYSRLGSLELYDANGTLINSSSGFGPAVDPELIQIELTPLTLFTRDRLKGQLAFDVNAAPNYDQILAQFRFDIDIAIPPVKTYQPKQVVTANGIDVLLDTVMMSRTYTNVYLCFQSPSIADWVISSKSTLQMDGIESMPVASRLLFDSAIGGDRRAGSEPYWAPPIKNGRCVKSTFPVGSNDLQSFTLQIPSLEQNSPDILITDLLSTNYPSLTIKQAYQTYLEEYQLTLKGPWKFVIDIQ